MKHLLRIALIGSAMSLAGCMTSGTNMHGDFACRAPTGTCAPMSSIDAKAVAGLGAGTQPVGGIADPAMPREGRVVTASADGSPPGRTSDRVLRVVFPAHIDASGIYHDESTAHAVIEHGGWTDGLTGGVRRTAAIETAEAPPPVKADGLQTSKLATLDEVIAARAAQGRKIDAAPAAAIGAATTPTSASAAMVPGSPRIAVMRSPIAVDLREAAAAASAQPVAGLDPNFDTPDVAAAVSDEPAASPDHCTGYRPLWWHGHAYRRLRPVPCPARVATSSGSDAATLAAASTSTRSLNLAHLEPATAITSPVSDAPKPGVAASTSSTSAPTHPVAPGAVEPVAGSTAKNVAVAPTSDPAVAAARVSLLARPLMSDQVRLGRADAKAAAPPPLGQLLAGTGMTAASVSGEAPR